MLIERAPDNWDGLAAAMTTMPTELLAARSTSRPRRPTTMADHTLSNGATIGRIAFSGLPWRIMGRWMTGVDCRVSDLGRYPRGTLIVASAHNSGVLATDLGAGKLMCCSRLPPGAALRGARRGDRRQQADRDIHQHLRLLPGSRDAILLGLATPISGGAGSFNIVVSKFNSGGTTVLGTVTFTAGHIVKTLALEKDLELADILVIAQVCGG